MNKVHAEVGDTITFPDGTSITVENITPAVAELYLAKNTHNRTLRPTKIGQYASDMQAGRWRWNGSTIVFGHSGQMDDGQHRCHAVIESGCTVRMLVVRGAELGAQETIDTGIGRKFQDVLKLRGETQWVSLAAAVRSIHVWEMGVRRIGNAGGRTISNPQLLNTLDRSRAADWKQSRKSLHLHFKPCRPAHTQTRNCRDGGAGRLRRLPRELRAAR